MIGVSDATQSRAENGKQDVRLGMLRKIANGLKTTAAELISDATPQIITQSGTLRLKNMSTEGLRDLQTIMESDDTESIDGLLSSLRAYARSAALAAKEDQRERARGEGGKRG